MIPVGWLAPTGHWDANTLRLLFENELYPTGLKFKRHAGYPNTDGAIVVIPGRYWYGNEAEIGGAVFTKYRWVLAILISDEENRFNLAAVDHPNLKWWIQTPHPQRDYGDSYLFGVGHTPHFNKLPRQPPERSLDAFLSAQNTHYRRNECFHALSNVSNKYARETEAFTEGITPDGYARQMVQAKVAPCPSGPATPDTFRTYEALEAHTIPIADDWSPAYDGGAWPQHFNSGYWATLYPDTPMPILTKYSDLPGYINDALTDYPRLANRVAAWWMREKRRMARRVKADLQELGAL